MILASDGREERHIDRIAQLEKLLTDFKRALFGAKSEKVDPGQFELALEDIETAVESIQAAEEADDRQVEGKPRPRKANRGALPKHLPRIEDVIEPDSTTCTCGSERHIIGEDVSERLDIIPAQFRVIVSRTIGQRLMSDLDALMGLPVAEYEACDHVTTRATSISMVRYKSNDYSVPVAYAHHDVHVRGFVHEVIIGCGNEIIARHKRSYTKADMIFDPLHFLPLIEQKIGALDQAAPLQGWDLPDVFATLHRLLEARMGKAGKREYVQVLRLMETFDMDVVKSAIQQSIDLGAIGYDAVKHLVLCRIEKRPPRLDLDFYPYLPKANVGTTSPSSYMSLVGGTAA